MISNATRQAYSEVDEFIELLNEKDRQKIPQDIRNLFKKEKDKEYKKEINMDIPIKEQNLKRETLAIIAMLNLKYWCKNEEEKQKLKEIYKQNEIKYQEQQREKYNPDDIFKKKQIGNNNENIKLLKYKKEKSFINKIFEKIKSILRKTIK